MRTKTVQALSKAGFDPVAAEEIALLIEKHDLQTMAEARSLLLSLPQVHEEWIRDARRGWWASETVPDKFKRLLDCKVVKAPNDNSRLVKTPVVVWDERHERFQEQKAFDSHLAVSGLNRAWREAWLAWPLADMNPDMPYELPAFKSLDALIAFYDFFKPANRDPGHPTNVLRIYLEALHDEQMTAFKGGSGSGNFGHAGRPGEVGGSTSRFASGTGDTWPSKKPLENEIDVEALRAGKVEGKVEKWFVNGDPLKPDDWVDPAFEAGVAGERKAAVCKALCEATGERYDDISTVLGTWAMGANLDVRSLFIQRLASQMFEDAALSEWQRGRVDKMLGDRERWIEEQAKSVAFGKELTDREYEFAHNTLPHELRLFPFGDTWETGSDGYNHRVVNNDKEVARRMKNVLSAMYDATQQSLADAGIDEIVAYRGVLLTKEQHKELRMGQSVQGLGNALGSWTLHPDVAQKGFAVPYDKQLHAGYASDGHTYGVVLKARIPRERILSSPLTGFGCSDEWEIVVLGDGTGTATVQNLILDGKPMAEIAKTEWNWTQEDIDNDLYQKAWVEEDHPRHPAGTEHGGQFAPADGASAATPTSDENSPTRPAFSQRMIKDWSEVEVSAESAERMKQSLLLNGDRARILMDVPFVSAKEKIAWMIQVREEYQGLVGAHIQKYLEKFVYVAANGIKEGQFTLGDYAAAFFDTYESGFMKGAAESIWTASRIVDQPITLEDAGTLDGMGFVWEGSESAAAASVEEALREGIGAAEAWERYHSALGKAVDNLNLVGSDDEMLENLKQGRREMRRAIGMAMSKNSSEFFASVPKPDFEEGAVGTPKSLDKLQKTVDRVSLLASVGKEPWGEFRSAMMDWLGDAPDKAISRALQTAIGNYGASADMTREDRVAMAFAPSGFPISRDNLSVEDIFAGAKRFALGAAENSHYMINTDAAALIEGTEYDPAVVGSVGWDRLVALANEHGVKVPIGFQEHAFPYMTVKQMAEALNDDALYLGTLGDVTTYTIKERVGEADGKWEDVSHVAVQLASKPGDNAGAQALLSQIDYSTFDGSPVEAVIVWNAIRDGNPFEPTTRALRTIAETEMRRWSESYIDNTTGQNVGINPYAGEFSDMAVEVNRLSVENARSDQKDDIAKHLAKKAGMSYERASDFVASWASSSNKGSSAFIQKAAGEFFNTKPTAYQEAAAESNSAGERFTGDEIKQVLAAMYDRTQEWFAERGVSHVVLYRGTSLPQEHYDAIKEWGGPFEYDDNVLASWSLKTTTASDFAWVIGGGAATGVVLEAVVPVDRILSNAFTGFGCLTEYEFVVIGSDAPAYARVFNKVTLPDQEAFPYKAWDPEKHPRHPAGSEHGGQFAPADGAGAANDSEWPALPVVAREEILREERKSAFYGFERLTAFNPDGELLFQEAGTHLRVSMPLYEKRPDAGALLTHNHTNFSAFSEADLDAAISFRLQEMRAVVGQTVSVMRLPRIDNYADREAYLSAALKAYKETDELVRAHVAEMHTAGKMTRQEANHIRVVAANHIFARIWGNENGLVFTTERLVPEHPVSATEQSIILESHKETHAGEAKISVVDDILVVRQPATPDKNNFPDATEMASGTLVKAQKAGAKTVINVSDRRVSRLYIKRSLTESEAQVFGGEVMSESLKVWERARHVLTRAKVREDEIDRHCAESINSLFRNYGWSALAEKHPETFEYHTDWAPGFAPEDLGNRLIGEGVLNGSPYKAWVEEDHPRHPAGSEQGGQFAPADGATSSDDPPALTLDMSAGEFWQAYLANGGAASGIPAILDWMRRKSDAGETFDNMPIEVISDVVGEKRYTRLDDLEEWFSFESIDPRYIPPEHLSEWLKALAENSGSNGRLFGDEMAGFAARHLMQRGDADGMRKIKWHEMLDVADDPMDMLDGISRWSLPTEHPLSTYRAAAMIGERGNLAETFEKVIAEATGGKDPMAIVDESKTGQRAWDSPAIPYAPVASLVKKVDEGARTNIGDVIKNRRYRKITPQDVEKYIDRLVERAAALYPVATRASLDDVDSIIASGRLMSQFETGDSSGDYAPFSRQRAENNGMGVPYSIDPALHPIYGYLSTPQHAADMYGDVEFVMKNDIKGRTTITAGDSLSNYERGAQYGLPISVIGDTGSGWVSNPATMVDAAKEKWPFDRAINHLTVTHSYIEAQMHGGVSLSDVDNVIYHHKERSLDMSRKAGERVRRAGERFDAAGIPFTVSNDGEMVSWREFVDWSDGLVEREIMTG